MSLFQSFAKYIASAFGATTVAESTESSLAPGEVRIDGVSKRFRKRTAVRSGYTTVKTGLLKGRERSPEVSPSGYFHALKDVSIHVQPGKALGLIGRNGSGKSTLLKLISGIYLPDQGQVKREGRISALIELGAGFHPDFSGRENIYLGGVMYGLTRQQIDERFDAIVEYAELADCIDDPVRTYSSGMYMRLGFSLAIHTDPDILLIDEVLAVGDASFISKCHDTISELKRKGKTLIFVTHDLPSVVRWCDEVIWLAHGEIKRRGEPRRIIDAYLAEVEESHKEKLDVENQKLSEGSESATEEGNSERWGSKDVELFDVRMQKPGCEAGWLFDAEDSVVVRFRYRIKAPVEDLVFGVGIERADGLQVHGTNTDIEQISLRVPERAQYPIEGSIEYVIDRIGLVEGTYFLDVAAHRADGYSFDYHHRMHKFSVRASIKSVGVCSPPHRWLIDQNLLEDRAAVRKLA